MEFVVSPRKKPYPDGIIYILNNNNLKPSQALMVDDRLLTGILAAEMTQVHGVLIKKPEKNLKSNFIKESFFIVLRFLEKITFL